MRIKKFACILMACLTSFSCLCSAFAADLSTDIAASEGAEVEVTPRAISISWDLSIDVGDSLFHWFDTAKLFEDDHNAFKVSITDTSGPYKVIVYSANGDTRYETGTRTGDLSWVCHNADPDTYYYIYVYNMDTSKLTGHLRISSFYE
mgnify:CR=1 FL=1